MSDSVDTTEAPAATAATEAPAASAKDDALPDWARRQITDANAEAARNRVQLREAQAANSTLQEQIATLSSEKAQYETASSTVQTDFDKLATAVQTLYPETHSQVFTFAKTLQGSTEEDLAKHAAELNSMFGISTGPSPAVDRSQGHGSGAPASDPALEFAALLKSKLTR